MLIGEPYRVINQCKFVFDTSQAPYKFTSIHINFIYLVEMAAGYDDISINIFFYWVDMYVVDLRTCKSCVRCFNHRNMVEASPFKKHILILIKFLYHQSCNRGIWMIRRVIYSKIHESIRIALHIVMSVGENLKIMYVSNVSILCGEVFHIN